MFIRRMMSETSRWLRSTGLAAALVLVSSAAFAQDPPTTPPTTPPSGTGGRQPVITNQFGTTTGGALQARRPGLYVQNAISVQQGTAEFFDGSATDEPSFLKDTFVQMFQAVLDSVSQFLSTLSLANIFGGTTGTGGGTTTPTLPNPTTTGTGSVPIQ